MKKTDTKSPAQSLVPPAEKEPEQKIAELTNNWKRALADYHNLERRVNQDKAAMSIFFKEALIKKLLPSLDNLEKVALHSTDEGLKLSLKGIFTALESEGLEEIAANGKDFDPRYMEAIDVIAGEKNDKVVTVFAKGYKIGDKVIRPAKVAVSKNSIKNVLN